MKLRNEGMNKSYEVEPRIVQFDRNMGYDIGLIQF